MGVFNKYTIIAASGSHKGYTQVKIEKIIKDYGAEFSKVVDEHTTHLITTEADYAKPSVKVTQAQENQARIVSLQWLLDSVEENSRQPEVSYEFESQKASKTIVASSQGHPKSQAKVVDPLDQKTVSKKRTSSRKKSEDDNEDEIDDKKEPLHKKQKKASSNTDSKDEKSARKAKVQAGESDQEKDVVKMKTVIQKGKAPVDELCPLANTHHVYVDESGTPWDATLNQTNIGANNNKFYHCQLLQNDAITTSFAVFCHWGRVGERGQSKIYIQDTGLDQAKKIFEKQMKAKTGKHWAEREQAIGGGGKYAYLSRNYEGADDQHESAEDGEKRKAVESTLEKSMQDLMHLIFNITYMQQTMRSLSYDSNKLPLGKLSKDTIMRGYSLLKDISDFLADPSLGQKKFGDLGRSNGQILSELASRYYTVIPHDFGRNAPPVIDTPQKLRKETELVENLVDMKISNEIMNESKGEDNVHPIDKQYQSLGLDEMKALDKKSAEFKNLEQYLKKTHGHTHRMNLKIEDIFRVSRSIEHERWQNDGWDNLGDKDNRMLLWHGSRTTNFSGILSQGLRIAPPEAPVSGYMFDKGIYLADIVSKSAGYCCSHISGGTGLLLLCEAQLGNPMYELLRSDGRAAVSSKQFGAIATKGLGRTVPLEWEDASVINDDLKGVKIPKVTGKEKNITGDSELTGASLQYNEYITYNVSQVKIRYLFRCQF